VKVAVVGGGPSGLVILKNFITAHNFLPVEPIEARLFEPEAQIGGTFIYRTYENAEVRCPCCTTLAHNALRLIV
jgi:dimethylaniline monooxygenase (N-oxide forming)